MKYKAIAIPKPSPGVDFSKEVALVVPDQSMSLQEILKRFTRGESLPIGVSTEYGDENLDNPLNVDLEKIRLADLVDQADYVDKLKDVKTRYDKQEKQKAAKIAADKAAAAKAADEKRIQEAARELAAKESSKKSA